MAIRILQINTVVNYGSTGRIVEAIGKEILEKGWESYVGYGRFAKPSDSKTLQIGSKIDNYFHVFKTRCTDRHGFGSRSATRALIKEIIKVDPNIIHLHNIHGYYLNIEILFTFLKELNIPIVWTLHDCWSFTGHCAYYSFKRCERWKKGCYECPQLSSYPESWVDNSNRNFNDKKNIFTSVKNLTLVPVSDWLNKELEESFLKNFPTKVIKNGIDLNSFNCIEDFTIRDKLDVRGKYIILGVANVWDQRKGLDDFIEFNEYLREDEKMILIGLNGQQMKSLPKNIIGIQKTESIKELVSFYSEADIFLNLTSEDNYPTTNLEAIACGTPVITYNTGGSIESVDTKTGHIVEKGDLKGLRQKIDLSKTKSKSFYKKNCREKAVLEFNERDKFKKYINLYSSLLKESYGNTE